MTGLPFVQALCALAGIGAVLVGLGLLMAATARPYSRETSAAEAARRSAWKGHAERPWRELSGWAGGRFVATLEGFASRGFSRVQATPAWSMLFLGAVWGFIPVASLVNLLIGGSPFLFCFFLAVVAAVALLIVLGETRGLGPLRRALALFAGLSILVLLPGYVAFAFTKVTLVPGFSHRVLQAPLVAVFWYLSCWGGGVVFDWLLLRPGRAPVPGPVARFVHQALAVAPFAYVLFFAALLCGHLSVYEDEPMRDWRLLSVAVGATAICVPACLAVLRRTTRLPLFAGLASVLATSAVAAVLGLAIAVWGYADDGRTAALVLRGLLAGGADGAVHVSLGPPFWVVHMPFLVPLALFACLLTEALRAVVARFAVRSGPTSPAAPDSGSAAGGFRIVPLVASAVVAGLWAVLLLSAAWAAGPA